MGLRSSSKIWFVKYDLDMLLTGFERFTQKHIKEHIRDASMKMSRFWNLSFKLKSAYDLGLILCHPKEVWESPQSDAFSQCTGQHCSLAKFSPRYEVPESRNR